MADRIIVSDNDFDTECKLKGDATITPTGKELMTIGPVPKDKQPNFSVTVRPVPLDGGDPKLVVTLDWDNARLDIRENLLSRLLKAVEDSIKELGSISVGKLREAIENIADNIRSVISESRIRFDFSFLYKIKIEGKGAHSLLVEHAHRFLPQQSQTFAGPERTNSVIDTRLAVAGVTGVFDLFYMRRMRPGQTKVIPSVDYASGIVKAFSVLPLNFKVGLEVYFAGFGNLLNIDATLQRLTEIAQAASDLADDSFAAARALIKGAAKKLGFDDEDDVDDLKKSDLAENLKKLTKLIMKTFTKLFKDAINEFVEQIRLDENIVTVQCVKSEAAKNYIKDSGGKKDVDLIGLPGSLPKPPVKKTPVTPVPQNGATAVKPADGSGEKDPEDETVGTETDPREPENAPADRRDNNAGPGSFSIDPDVMLVPVFRNPRSSFINRDVIEVFDVNRRRSEIPELEAADGSLPEISDFIALRRR